MIEVFCGPQSGNGKPHRLVALRNGEREYLDRIDVDSGFQRAMLLERAAEQFDVGVDDLKPLDREIVRQAGIEDHRTEAGDGKEPLPFTQLLDGAELLALDIRPSFLVKGVLVEGQPMIMGGRPKTLKTGFACDLVVSLGSGTPFLGRFDVPRQVTAGFWSGESGAATIRETAKRQARPVASTLPTRGPYGLSTYPGCPTYATWTRLRKPSGCMG